jgi:ankyrin repeat protein
MAGNRHEMSERNSAEIGVGDAVEMARRGDTVGLTSWLTGGGDPNTVDHQGWTPLLAASARGKAKVVDLLLNHAIVDAKRADPNLRFAAADALPVYMAGQAGDVETVRILLKAVPSHIHAISRVNGHTVLLQATFFGKSSHLELARYLLDHVCEILGLPDDRLSDEQTRLTTATNVRGLTPLGMALFWNNKPMADLLLLYPQPRDEERQKYLNRLLLGLADPQALTERMIAELKTWQAKAAESSEPKNSPVVVNMIAKAKAALACIMNMPKFEINRLGGPLYQTPLIFAITGTDSNEAEAEMRHELVRHLLKHGKADPTVVEKHPMAIGAVIRASVLNQFPILQLLAEYLSPEVFVAEMNKSPAVNGLTAMHDAVHRALTASQETLHRHIDQIRWMIEKGSRTDIPDHCGQTQLELAGAASHDNIFNKENVNRVRVALELSASPGLNKT